MLARFWQTREQTSAKQWSTHILCEILHTRSWPIGRRVHAIFICIANKAWSIRGSFTLQWRHCLPFGQLHPPRYTNIINLLALQFMSFIINNTNFSAEVGDYQETFGNSSAYFPQIKNTKKFFPHQNEEHVAKIVDYHKNHV